MYAYSLNYTLACTLSLLGFQVVSDNTGFSRLLTNMLGVDMVVAIGLGTKVAFPIIRSKEQRIIAIPIGGMQSAVNK